LRERIRWKAYIDAAVRVGIYAKKLSSMMRKDQTDSFNGMTVRETSTYAIKERKFPYGIYFGSRIKDIAKNRIGCEVCIKEDYNFVAFDGEDEPQIITVEMECFDKGIYSLV
jgi:hypothetical protein